MTHIIREYTIAELKELDFPWGCEVVSDEAYESDRWMEYHEAVIRAEDDGLHYAINYQQGLTECQEVDFEDKFFENPVKAVRVELKQVMVEKWLPVETDNA